ncbi:MAG TPA: arylsulfatase [Planctomycetota bacterium]|nr:arylsulfatase [Planctomycetota bacterium]
MPEPPNILFIFTDQMRWDCMSCAGHPVVETPNIDEIGRRGVVFGAAYASVPSCIAARASIFTGLAPTNHHRLGYQDQVPWGYENMLAEVLASAGYQTHCIGKTHFYPQRKPCGFDGIESDEGLQNFDGRYVNDYHEWLREEGGGRFLDIDHGLQANSWAARPSPMPEHLHRNWWAAGRAIDFLRQRDRSRPFFLFVSFIRPHPPIDPPQVFYDMYRDREIPETPVGGWAARHDVPVSDLNCWQGRLPERTLAHTRRAYFAQVAHIDSQIGRVLAAFRPLKVRNTAILFSADHGEMLGDHHLWRKTYAYEGSAAVPLVMSLPDAKPKGGLSFCDAPVISEDLYPTILDLAGASVPNGIDGRSFLHLVRDPESGDRRDYVHGEHSPCYHESTGMQYLIDGKEKYIWYTLSGEEQLFDLVDDPTELRNLAPDPKHKGRLELWRGRLVAELAPRTEDGLSDGKKLLPGKTLPATRSVLLTQKD